jgi:hypothetical protein
MWKALIILVVSSLPVSLPIAAVAQQPEPAGENLLRLGGIEPATHIHYLKLIALLRPADLPPETAPSSLPRFTIECREAAGKRSMHWLVRFTGSSDFTFQPPALPTSSSTFPPENPSAMLKMRFEGYIHSQDFKRQWEILPNGELHYRNPGMNSSNLDDPRHFERWLTSLPNLRLTYVKPVSGQPGELVFPLRSLLSLVKKSDLCQP